MNNMLIEINEDLVSGWRGSVCDKNNYQHAMVWDNRVYIPGVEDDEDFRYWYLDLSRRESRELIKYKIALALEINTAQGLLFYRNSKREWIKGKLSKLPPSIREGERRFTDKMTDGMISLSKRSSIGNVWITIPDLSNIDPNIKETVSDGTNVRDILALKMIGMHVLDI